MRLSLVLWISTLAFLGLTGCEDDKEKNLYQAQTCIDTATAATVNSCLAFLGNDTSKKAYILRCSAIFISQGITEDAIIDALENIDGEESGDPTAPTIAALAMDNTTTSTDAVNTCALSEADALIALASFANLATTMTSLLPGLTPPYSAADIEQAIANYNATPSGDPTELGNAILSSQESLCNTTNGLMKDTPVCTDINSAVAENPDPSDLGNSLLCQLEAETPQAKCECDNAPADCASL